MDSEQVKMWNEQQKITHRLLQHAEIVDKYLEESTIRFAALVKKQQDLERRMIDLQDEVDYLHQVKVSAR